MTYMCRKRKTKEKMNTLIKKIAGVAVMLVLVAGSAMAQNQKVGTINLIELISVMPGTAGVNAQLQTLSDSITNVTPQYKTTLASYDTKRKAFETGAKDWGEARREAEAAEIIKMENELLGFEQQVNAVIGQRREKLMQPVYKNAQTTLDQVAKANGFSLVLDSSTPILLYMEDAVDLMPLVKAKLGIQ